MGARLDESFDLAITIMEGDAGNEGSQYVSECEFVLMIETLSNTSSVCRER